MTADQESVEYWRSRALSAEKVVDDFEAMGVLHPSRVLDLKQRIAELEAQCLENSESRSIA